MKRYGSVIKVAPGKLEEYKRLHANVWESVKKMIKECHLENYSIYYKDGYLFSYYEYTGTDYAADMAKMAADPETQRWWTFCEPCQVSIWIDSLLIHTTKPDTVFLGRCVRLCLYWFCLVEEVSEFMKYLFFDAWIRLEIGRIFE